MTTLAGAPVGVQICYDIRFPELTRALAVGGASLVTVSAAWQAGLFKEEHWVTLLRARAIENTVWIAAVGQVPDPDEKPTRAPTGVGRSMLIDPLGVVRCDLGPSAGVTVVNADMSLVETVRATLPSLANRREDVFWLAVRRRQAPSGVPGDLERREGLGGGHQLDRVHVDVLRHGGRPVDRLGDVVGGHRLHARVDVVRLGPGRR